MRAGISLFWQQAAVAFPLASIWLNTVCPPRSSPLRPPNEVSCAQHRDMPGDCLPLPGRCAGYASASSAFSIVKERSGCAEASLPCAVFCASME